MGRHFDHPDLADRRHPGGVGKPSGTLCVRAEYRLPSRHLRGGHSMHPARLGGSGYLTRLHPGRTRRRVGEDRQRPVDHQHARPVQIRHQVFRSDLRPAGAVSNSRYQWSDVLRSRAAEPSAPWRRCLPDSEGLLDWPPRQRWEAIEHFGQNALFLILWAPNVPAAAAFE